MGRGTVGAGRGPCRLLDAWHACAQACPVMGHGAVQDRSAGQLCRAALHLLERHATCLRDQEEHEEGHAGDHGGAAVGTVQGPGGELWNDVPLCKAR